MFKVKKLLCVLLSSALLIGFTACDDSGKTPAGGSDVSSGATTKSETTKSDATVKTDESTKAEVETTEDPITLTFWVSEALVGPSEKKLPQEEWYLSQAINRFKEKHPNVTIEFTLLNDSAQTPQLLKAGILAGTAPDMASLWTGNNILSIKDILLPLNDYLPDDVRQHIGGWESVSENFDSDGMAYGLPFATQDLSFLYYNKKLIADAGLDFENNPPRTMEEFYEAMDKIKDTGIVPISTDEASGHNVLYFLFTYWWVQQTGIDGITSSNESRTKFADDEGLLQTLAAFRDLYSNGYMNEDALSADDAVSRFMQGSAAMHPSGTWRLDEFLEALGDDLGVIKPPNMDVSGLHYDNGLIGGPGEGMVVCNSTKYPEMAVEFLSFLASKEEFIEFYKIYTRIPNRNDIGEEDLDLNNHITPLLFDWAGDAIFFVDNMVEINAMQELARLSQDVLVGKMEPKACAEAMDRIVEDNL